MHVKQTPYVIELIEVGGSVPVADRYEFVYPGTDAFMLCFPTHDLSSFDRLDAYSKQIWFANPSDTPPILINSINSDFCSVGT